MRKLRATVNDPVAERVLDLVQRRFTAGRPDELWVVDFAHGERAR